MKEKEDAIVVYYANEEPDKVKEFFDFIRNEGFERKVLGPINSIECPWVFIFLYEKRFIVGKPGIEYAAERCIEHAVLIDEFKALDEIYRKTHTLDDERIHKLVKKYDNKSIFDFEI